MANYCGNDVVLVGSPESLTKVADAIRKNGENDKYVSPEGIMRVLGIEPLDKCGYSYDTAMGELDEINLDTINEGYLQFYCGSAWGDINGLWEQLCEECGLDGFAAFSEADGEYWIVNDPDGIWFPFQYVFDSYGEGTFADLETEHYNTKEELAAALNEIAEEEKTFDEWIEYMDEYDGSEGAIKVIEKEGNQLLPYKMKEELKIEETEMEV